MSNMLRQLKDHSAAAMLYLAGELPPEDRLEFERMIAGDAALAAEVENLRGLEDQIKKALVRLDAVSPLAMTPSAAAGQTSRAMVRWMALRSQPASLEKPVGKLRWAFWTYPLAAAALVTIVLGIWWRHHAVPAQMAAHLPPTQDIAPSEDQQRALARSIFGDDSTMKAVELTKASREAGDLFGEERPQ